MITASDNITNMLTSPVRKIQAKVEFYEGSTLVETCHCNDRLINFTVERIGDTSKFFGFGICQKINIHLIDKNRELSFSTSTDIKVAYGVDGEYIYPYPTFHITQVRRDENTNELSITAYDLMYPDSAHLVSDMELPKPYTLLYFVSAASNALKATGVAFSGISDISSFQVSYPTGGNFVGTETVREGLNSAAEATQTIYYINNKDQLTFKRFDEEAAAVLTINKDDYFTFESRPNRRLAKIVHTTELNENQEASTTTTGTTQYIRENPFWTMLNPSGLANELVKAIDLVGGLCINQFDCSWRGNYLLEVGDKINIVAKDNSILTSYVLDDVISFDGSLSEKTQWSYISNDEETPATPVSLGEALNQTFAKVDKVAREIELVAKQTEELPNQIASIKIQIDEIEAKVEELDFNEAGELLNQIAAIKLRVDELELKVQSLEEADGTLTSEMASIKIANDSIIATVEQVEANVGSDIDSIENALDSITQRLTTTVTTESIGIYIENELEQNGVSSVVTKTGFTLDEVGLTIDKAGTEMKTTITEDGMVIYRDANEVLTANNTGVYAENLHATTFLMMGKYSRFEDYTSENSVERTGCFWMGS